MSRKIEMSEIRLDGVPSCLVEFLRKNETLRLFAPLPAQVTAYMNPLATRPGTEPAFTLQIADFDTGVAKKIFLTLQEAEELETGRSFSRAADILAEAMAQGRRVWSNDLPERKPGAGGAP